MITFEPLWATMKEKHESSYTLIVKHGISRSLWGKLKHNRNVTLQTIDRLCEILDCDVADIVKHVPNDE
ncbi:MAG: helix-turn-helix transcriptional regulator [Lachnospiraceae bacterium]|nr:helix-turn-helix transcriptional regulator [Butyrivibrio sp.]MCM1343100.1 helix-turn-helix transcriptional regulator [Muribaculaceae bacterium]MCM1410421.1 helix-turn-helix transcriptional regulator [Lachnospiraceae bacterium]